MKPQPPNDDLQTMEEVAERLRITPGTLRNWRMRGWGPPGYAFGRKALYRRSDVDVFINDRFEPPVCPPEFTPPAGAPARGRYFPWPVIAEIVGEVVAETLGTKPTERNMIRNAVFDALPAAYDTYMAGVYAHAEHDISETEAMDNYRAALCEHLQVLQDARDATRMEAS